jgi:hypothetical protein
MTLDADIAIPAKLSTSDTDIAIPSELSTSGRTLEKACSTLDLRIVAGRPQAARFAI